MPRPNRHTVSLTKLIRTGSPKLITCTTSKNPFSSHKNLTFRSSIDRAQKIPNRNPRTKIPSIPPSDQTQKPRNGFILSRSYRKQRSTSQVGYVRTQTTHVRAPFAHQDKQRPHRPPGTMAGLPPRIILQKLQTRGSMPHIGISGKRCSLPQMAKTSPRSTNGFLANAKR